jgi:hypothetical protein
MSTPPAPPPSQGYDRPYYGGGMPPVPAPSGELVVFLLVWFVISVIALVTDGADGVDPRGFVTASVALAIGYMIARGIAKAGKVFENR